MVCPHVFVNTYKIWYKIGFRIDGLLSIGLNIRDLTAGGKGILCHKKYCQLQNVES
jgi:hypothetical protein